MGSEPVQRRLQFVLYQYDIAPVKEVSLSFFGMANEVFVITTETGKVVLKNCFKRNTAELVKNEVALIDHLNANGCPTPKIIPAKDGRLFVEFSGHFYVMTEYTDDRTITWSEPNKLRFIPETVEAMASFHKAMDSFEEPHSDLQLKVIDTEAYLVWLDGLEEELLRSQEEKAAAMLSLVPKFRQCAQRLQQAIDATDISPLKRCYVHGDMHCFNLFYDENDHFTQIIDFDFSRLDHRLADVYWASQIFYYQQLRHRFSSVQLDAGKHLEHPELASEILETNWKIIIETYRDILPLESAELRLMGLFVQAVPMYISRFFSLDNSDEECEGHIEWFTRELSIVERQTRLVTDAVDKILRMKGE
jgi:Ser/Thr protein kinase RdoA (MazF antagonist)